MSRKSWLFSVHVAASLSMCSWGGCSKTPQASSNELPAAPAEQRQTPPYQPPFDANLLFISLDTTRADHLSCYGYHRPTSPNIDRLAADATRFTHFYTVMPTTLPSHASMFTSLYPTQLGTLENGADVVPPEADTLAERLKAHGFSTAAFTAAYPLDKIFGLAQGFDVFQTPHREFRADQVCPPAIAWLKAHQNKRFFLFLHLYDPHTRYAAPGDFPRQFDAPPSRPPPHQLPPEFEFLAHPEQFTPQLCRDCINAYDAEIAYADSQIAQVLATLDQTGQRNRTIIVFLSDHGETMDELLKQYSYAFDHGEFLYRRELRIPFVLWLPPQFAHRGPAVCDQQASTLDIMPTLLELLGVPCEGQIEGQSLVPLLAGERRPTRKVFARRHDMPGDKHEIMKGGEFSIVDGRWHWIHRPALHDELYDMDADPDEKNNIIDAHKEYVRMMRSLMARFHDEKGKSRWKRRVVKVGPDGIRTLKDLGYLTNDSDASVLTPSSSSGPASRP